MSGNHPGRVASTTVEVEIYGSTFHVRGTQDSDHLQGLARFVDQKMREVAGHVATVDTTKIAILAALNLAEELLHLRENGGGTKNEITEKVAGLAGDLEKALESA